VLGVLGVLGGTGGGGGWLGKWPKTIGKAARKFAAAAGVLYRLIMRGILDKFFRLWLARLRQSMSWIL